MITFNIFKEAITRYTVIKQNIRKATFRKQERFWDIKNLIAGNSMINKRSLILIIKKKKQKGDSIVIQQAKLSLRTRASLKFWLKFRLLSFQSSSLITRLLKQERWSENLDSCHHVAGLDGVPGS